MYTLKWLGKIWKRITFICAKILTVDGIEEELEDKTQGNRRIQEDAGEKFVGTTSQSPRTP